MDNFWPVMSVNQGDQLIWVCLENVFLTTADCWLFCAETRCNHTRHETSSAHWRGYCALMFVMHLYWRRVCRQSQSSSWLGLCVSLA